MFNIDAQVDRLCNV